MSESGHPKRFGFVHCGKVTGHPDAHRFERSRRT